MLSSASKKTRQINIRLTDDEYRMLKYVSEKRKTSASDILIQYIIQLYNQLARYAENSKKMEF